MISLSGNNLLSYSNIKIGIKEIFLGIRKSKMCAFTTFSAQLSKYYLLITEQIDN